MRWYRSKPLKSLKKWVFPDRLLRSYDHFVVNHVSHLRRTVYSLYDSTLKDQTLSKQNLSFQITFVSEFALQMYILKAVSSFYRNPVCNHWVCTLRRSSRLSSEKSRVARLLLRISRDKTNDEPNFRADHNVRLADSWRHAVYLI